jgi:hypothetical protein
VRGKYVDILSHLDSFQFFLIAWKAEHDNVMAFQLSAISPAGGATQLPAFQQILLLFQKRFYQMPASPQGFCLVFHCAVYVWYHVMNSCTGFTSLVDRLVYMLWLVL